MKPIQLLEIKSIKAQNYTVSPGAQIKGFLLKGDDWEFYIDAQHHAFVDSEGKAKLASELKAGDSIWIDIHAFTADSSFKRINSNVVLN